MTPQNEPERILEGLLSITGPGNGFSRRIPQTDRGNDRRHLGLGSFRPGDGSAAPLIITEQAEGLVVADPTRCVGCRRCELACTEYNDGKASRAWPGSR